jgi:glycerophosphoryl diester phosphodiesterase
MPPRFSSLRPPIGFAHRGGRAGARENTIEAFELALEQGASGLESDAWLSSDGIVVLDHDGQVGLRRRRISTIERSALPGHIPALEELYLACGTGFELSLDVMDTAAVDTIVAVARAAGDDAASRLWLCHHDWQTLAGWRARFPDVRLVDSTRMRSMKESPERRAANLAGAGIDAINLHHSDWTGGHVTLFHRFGVLAFGWDTQLERVLDELLDLGIDGVYSDHVEVMAAAIDRAAG